MNAITQPINLDVFCNPERPALSKPFSEELWTYYSSGSMIVRVPRDPNVREREDAPKNVGKNIFREGAPIFTEPLLNLGLPDLEGWQDCDNCCGNGQCQCRNCKNIHACKTCKGTGKIPEQCRVVKFGHHLLNHLLLHKLAAHLPNVILLEYDENPQSPVGFRFDGGEGRLASMR